MPREKRFGRHHVDSVFKDFRKREFSNCSSSILLSSADDSFESGTKFSTPEKPRECDSDCKALLPNLPEVMEISEEMICDSREDSASNNEFPARRKPKLKLTRNSTLTTDGKAIDNVTFGQVQQVSSIGPSHSGCSIKWITDESSVKSSHSQISHSTILTEDNTSLEEACSGEVECSGHDRYENERKPESVKNYQIMSYSPRPFKKGTQIVKNAPSMGIIEENSSSEWPSHAPQGREFSDVELHLPDKIQKQIPRIITSSHYSLHVNSLPETCELSSITQCGEGDNSSGLCFKPQSREVISTEALSLNYSDLKADVIEQKSCQTFDQNSHGSENVLLRSYSCPSKCQQSVLPSPSSQLLSKPSETLSVPLDDISNKGDPCILRDENDSHNASLPFGSPSQSVKNANGLVKPPVQASPGVDTACSNLPYEFVYSPAQSASEVKYVPLHHRSEEEQQVIESIDSWLQNVPLTESEMRPTK